MHKQILFSVINTAIQAGEEIIKIYNSDNFEVELKSDNSSLTRADKVSHNIILSGLSNIPKQSISQSINQESEMISGAGHSIIEEIPLLSEEGKEIPYETRKKWKRYWLIDPLDGTKEFIKRNGEFTVNIALIENNEPVLGVIYAPAYETESSKFKAESVKSFENNILYDEEAKMRRGEGEKGQSESGHADMQSYNHTDTGQNRMTEWLYECMEQLNSFPGVLYFAIRDEGSYKIVNDELWKIPVEAQSVKLKTQSSKSKVQSAKLKDQSSKSKAQSSKPKAHSPQLTAVSSRSHSSDEEKRILNEFGVTDTISVGSSLKFCMVAEDKAQIYYRHGPTMEWDVAAGYVIAKESGAEIDGLEFNKENLLNSSFLVKRHSTMPAN